MPYASVAWQDSSNQDIWLISPLIDLTGAASAHISFDQLGMYGTSIDYHGIWYSYTNASPRWLDSREWFELEELPAASEGVHETVNLSLDDLVGENVFLAFRYQGFFADIWFVDDVEIGPGDFIESDPQLATSFEIVGNLPNPFNSATTIRANVHGEGVVEIFDIGGHLIRNLPITGSTAVWRGETDDGKISPCGVYFYRLSGTTDTHRMVFIK